jgi:hypothetical protein
MSTSREMAFLSEVLEADKLPESAFVYFRGKLQNDVHVALLNAFVRSGLKQIDLSRRIDKSPEIVNRWIGATGNWTLNSIADFFLGMGARLEVSVVFLKDELAKHSEPKGNTKNQTRGLPVSENLRD